METENKVLCMVFVCLLLILASVVGCWMYTDYKIAEMVKAGTHPIEAKIALMGTSDEMTCLYQAHLMGKK